MACCLVGARLNASEIDAALRGGASVRAVAAQFGLGKTAVSDHRACLGLRSGPPCPPLSGGHPADTTDIKKDRAAQSSASGVPTQDEPVSEVVPDSETDSPRRPPTFPIDRYDEAATSQAVLRRMALDEQAHDLRLAGKNFNQIGRELGISPDAACDAIYRWIGLEEKRISKKAEQNRLLEIARLEKLLASLWARATDPSMVTVDVPADNQDGLKPYDGQDKAADRILKITEQLAKLRGLVGKEPAVQVNISIDGFGRSVGAWLLARAPELASDFAEWIAAAQGGDQLAQNDPAGWVAQRQRVVIDAVPEGSR